MTTLVLKGRVFSSTDHSAIEDGVVVIENNLITAVGKQGEIDIPADATIKTYEDGTIMPGMIDVHVHFGLHSANTLEFYTHTHEERLLRTLKDFEKYVDAGFTSVREVGGLTHLLKKPVASNGFKAPRISASGLIVSQTGGHQDAYQTFPSDMNHVGKLSVLADGVPEVLKHSRENFRAGADFIKLNMGGGFLDNGTGLESTEYTEEEVRAVVETAQTKGSYVAAHCHGIAAMKKAIRCGIRTIEHGTFMDDEIIELCLEHGNYVVPTFTIGGSFFAALEHMPPWLREKAESMGGLKLLEDAGARHAKAYRAGVKYGLGTDTVGDALTPFNGCGREFGFMVKHMGLSPAEAIIAGTRTNSEIIQKDDIIGTLEQGKHADIIVVDGNPLKDISLLGQPDSIKLVLIDGQVQKETE